VSSFGVNNCTPGTAAKRHAVLVPCIEQSG
jgi:hypothetical protein